MGNILEQRRGSECVDPVLVPESLKYNFVDLRFKDCERQFVIQMRVDTELFQFLVVDHLEALAGYLLLLFLSVFIRVCSETSYFDFSCRNRLFRVYNDSYCRVRMSLKILLGVHVYS